MTEILPDSRAREARGPVQTPMGWMVPIFCANCGREGGLVPEENCNFAFWLCTPCFQTHGELAGTMAIPDHAFFEQVKEEQLEKYGRILSPQELEAIVESDTSPLATLIRTRGR